MKVIFLDIDGVLAVHMQDRHDQFGAAFHPQFINNLKSIIDTTNAKIVISSSWRFSGLNIMKLMWEYRKLPGEVIDITPSLRLQHGGGISFYNNKINQHPTPKIHGYSIPRGCEIEYWLNNESLELIDSYVIIDDDTDMLYDQRNNYVCTSGNMDHSDYEDIGYGLTKECAEQAIKILNKFDHK